MCGCCKQEIHVLKAACSDERDANSGTESVARAKEFTSVYMLAGQC